MAEQFTPAERSMLQFALERAADAVAQEPDEFTAEDRAALASLERKAAE